MIICIIFRFISKYKNKCKIIALQGTDDWMVDVNEKMFISQLDNAQLLIIHPDEVDGVLCKMPIMD